MPIYGRTVRADECGAAIERDGLAKAVVRTAIARDELLREAPNAVDVSESIDGALT